MVFAGGDDLQQLAAIYPAPVQHGKDRTFREIVPHIRICRLIQMGFSAKGLLPTISRVTSKLPIFMVGSHSTSAPIFY